RVNGEKKELKDEVVALAKKHGITTPYTSYLIVPDSVPVANASPTLSSPRLQFAPMSAPPAGTPGYIDVDGSITGNSGRFQAPNVGAAPAPAKAPAAPGFQFYSGMTRTAPANGTYAAPAPPVSMECSGKAGVDLSLQLNELRNQNQVGQSA